VPGALAVPIGLAPTYAEAPTVYGWWSLAVAVLVLVVSVQLRVGALSAISWALVTVAYAALAPWTPLMLPWTFLPEVAGLLLVGELLAWVAPTPDDTGGLPRWAIAWDDGAFIAAHGVAALGLAAALVNGWIPATWCGTGGLALVVAARRRAVAGTGLVLVGAAVACWGPLALALAVTSVAATAFAVTATTVPTRLEYLGMLLVVSPALVQIAAVNLFYALLALADGLALAAWGTITRVRRRALFGVASIVLAAALVVLVPMADLVPKVRGPGLWLAIAAVGLLAVLVAAFLEQGRGVAERAVIRLRDLTSDWE
jgi:hypothetical protein